jgi:hypothetical protein
MKESIFRNFLEDPLLYEKKYLTPQEAQEIVLYEPHNNRLVEVFRLFINNYDPGDSDLQVKKIINNSFRNL